VFQDGSEAGISSASWRRRQFAPRSRAAVGVRRAVSLTGHRRRRSGGGPHLRGRPSAAGLSATDADTAAPRDRSRGADTTARPPLPFQQFQALCTLFSKFFSPFPRGTCSLSVSRSCLALDGIYHPLGAALASNSTRRESDAGARRRAAHTGLSPSLAPRSMGVSRPPARGVRPLDYNSTDRRGGHADFQFELASHFTRRYCGNPG